MARPVKKRRICEMPQNCEFVPCRKLSYETVELTLDEYETIRLIDYVGLTQEECAGQMKVARTTVQAIYDTARKKIADMLVNGKRLEVSGGSYDVCVQSATCKEKWCCKMGCGRQRCEEKR